MMLRVAAGTLVSLVHSVAAAEPDRQSRHVQEPVCLMHVLHMGAATLLHSSRLQQRQSMDLTQAARCVCQLPSYLSDPPASM
jgi:hypothetical protein